MRDSRLSRLPVIGIIAVTLTLSFSVVPASAGGSNHPHTVTAMANASSGPLRAGVGVPGATLPLLSGTHYVYADDGLEYNNTIDEFKATASGLTHLGTVRTGSYSPTLAYGQNNIAVRGSCLVHSDSGGSPNGGSIQSYSINGSTGLLTRVSTLAVPLNGHQIFPGDTKISSSGQDAFISAWDSSGGGQLISIPLSSSCAFGTAVYFTVPSRDEYYAIVLPDANHLLAVNYSGSTNDIYTITNGTILTLEKSNPSSVVSPSGATTGTVLGQTYTFNGQATFGVPQAEADKYTASSGTLTPAPGSPQTDGNTSALSGANVNFAPAYNLLTQTNTLYNAPSTTVAAYSISRGAFVYKNSATLDPWSSDPVSQAVLGHYLGVLATQSRTIDACKLTTSGVSSCVLVATLSGDGYNSGAGGLAVK